MSRLSEPLTPVRVPVLVPAPTPPSAALPGPNPASDTPGSVPAPAEEPAAQEEPPSRLPVALLSGASGVVGEAVARALRADFHVIALRGRRASVHAHGEIAVDLAVPRLGLAPEAWADLAARADVVVHAGGRACFDDRADDFHCVNVSGSRRMAELAHDADAPLIHISTAFVEHVDHVRAAAAAIPGDCAAQPLTYLESKIAAERAVAASDALACVVRPSVVMGDSGTGWTPELQAVHGHIKMLLTGMQVSACGPYQRLDMVPRDRLARAVAGLANLAVRDPGRLPALYRACAGNAAPTCAEFAEQVLDAARRQGLRLPRPEFHDPAKTRLADYPGWRDLPERLRTVLAVQAAGSTTLGVGEVFPTSFGGPELPGGPKELTPEQALANLDADIRFVMAGAR